MGTNTPHTCIPRLVWQKQARRFSQFELKVGELGFPIHFVCVSAALYHRGHAAAIFSPKVNTVHYKLNKARPTSRANNRPLACANFRAMSAIEKTMSAIVGKKIRAKTPPRLRSFPMVIHVWIGGERLLFSKLPHSCFMLLHAITRNRPVDFVTARFTTRQSSLHVASCPM